MFFLHEVEVKLRSPADQVEVKLRLLADQVSKTCRHSFGDAESLRHR